MELSESYVRVKLKRILMPVNVSLCVPAFFFTCRRISYFRGRRKLNVLASSLLACCFIFFDGGDGDGDLYSLNRVKGLDVNG